MFIGDLHIGKMCKFVGREASLALHRQALKAQVAEARMEKCTHICVVGDVYDAPFPDIDAMLLMIEEISAAPDLKWLVYSGNHDVHDASHVSLKLLQRLPEAGALRNAIFVTARRFLKWGGLKLFVLPWGERIPANLKGADLALFHDSVCGATRDNGTKVPPGRGLPSDAFGDVPGVSGHLHTPHRCGSNRFVGTYCQMSFGEGPVKRLTFMDVSEGQTRFTSKVVEKPTWRMATVRFDAKNPPACDDESTFYRVQSEGSPPPGWLTSHPRVVQVAPGSKTADEKLKRRVADLMEGAAITPGEDDRALVQRWLHQHSGVDALSRASAMRIHDKLDVGD
jgi:hypothetical protein